MLLTAPKYFKLKETKIGTVLVEDGVFVKEETSKKYGNPQYYFMDRADRKLKCLSGGQIGYIMDTHNIYDYKDGIKITYAGMEKIENGDFKGSEAHQFEIELLGEVDLTTPEAKTSEAADPVETSGDNSLDSLA
jgi:hypothetical protein